MSKTVITLDIDSAVIRLLETRGNRVTKWASVSLEPGDVEGKAVSNPQALSTKVKQLMASSGITGRNVIASFTGLYSVSRILKLPSPPKGRIASEAVLEAAGEVMPLDTDKLYLSWQTIAIGEGVQEVFVVGVPRDIIDANVQALKAAGINPRVLDIRTMALGRVVNREQALVLNIEPSSFDIVTVVRGIPEIMRTIAWGQDELTVDDKAEYLASALRLTVDFYNSRHPDTPLDPATPMFVTGQMSEDLALREKLQARLSCPFEPLTPPLEYPEHLPVSEYAVNMGLALKGRTPSNEVEQGNCFTPDINFLPAIYYPWKPSRRQLYFVGAVIVAIFLLFQVYQVTSDALAETANLQTRYDILNTELQKRQLEIKNRVPLQKAIAEYNTISNLDGNFTEDLRVIDAEAAEHGVRLISVTHKGSIVTISWEVESYFAIENYLDALEKSGRFSTPIPRPETGYPLTTSGTTELEVETGGE